MLRSLAYKRGWPGQAEDHRANVHEKRDLVNGYLREFLE
jgi:hypothetical protein